MMVVNLYKMCEESDFKQNNVSLKTYSATNAKGFPSSRVSKGFFSFSFKGTDEVVEESKLVEKRSVKEEPKGTESRLSIILKILAKYTCMGSIFGFGHDD